MRLQDEKQPDEPSPYASGEVIPGHISYDPMSNDYIISAAAVRELQIPSGTEWFSRALSQVVPGLQGGEVIGYGPPPQSVYPNRSERSRAYHLKVAVDRDNRLNTEEQAEYNRTMVELEYGIGFFQRAHP